MMHETSTDHFKYFKERCFYWIEKLKCDEWDWSFMHDAVDGGLAQYDLTYSGRAIDVTLNKKWKEQPTKERLDRVAFHEVYEGGVLSTLRSYALMIVGESAVDEEVHRIVRKMENLFVGYNK